MRVGDRTTLEAVLWWGRCKLRHMYSGLDEVDMVGKVRGDGVFMAS